VSINYKNIHEAVPAVAPAEAVPAITVLGITEISPPVRLHEMVCYQINITEDNKFELIFWYEYGNNNWITIYDKDGNLVYRKDFPHGQPTVIIDLPDGTYTVKTFHEEGKILQEFIIGKP